MKMRKNIFLFMLFLGVVFFSCKKDHPVVSSPDFGYNYFPNDVGRYIICQVDSISYDDPLSRPPDTTRYLLKELIAATFFDNSGRPTLRIERYYKMYHFNTHSYDSVWSVPRVWSANRTTSTAEKVEENIRYIKLVFPVRQNKQWNGNVYNMLGSKEYQITSADQSETINTVHFDSVATVSQFDEENLVLSQIEKEKFARNVGLIYKQRDSLVKQGTNFADTTGYRVTQKIISYGKQ